MRVRKPLDETNQDEQKSSEKSEQRKPPKQERVRKPRIDLEPSLREQIEKLERQFESVGLRRLSIRKYEYQGTSWVVMLETTEYDRVPYDGTGKTLSQALARAIHEAARKK